MNTTFHRDSARIYTFPKWVPTKIASYDDHGNSVVSLASRRVASTALGDAWYHEAAIEEDRQKADGK